MGNGSSNTRIRTALSLRRGDSGSPRKILVLGCLGSGKSTLCRSLSKAANAPQPPFRLYKHTIENNLLEAYKAVFILARQMGVDINKYTADLTILMTFRHKEDLHSTTIEAIRRLSKASTLMDFAREKNRVLDLPHNFFYLIQSTDRILARNYDPTESDVLACYSQTVGINYHAIKMSNSKYELIELPGHHIFRRSWQDFFNDTTVIIFVIDLSDICRTAFYNKGHLQGKVKDILRSIVTHPLLSKTAFILLFNKKDVLEECSESFPFEQMGHGIKNSESAEKWYMEECLGVIPPTHRIFRQSRESFEVE